MRSEGGQSAYGDSPRGTGIRLALDLGTSTLAGRLLGPHDCLLAEAEQANPQRGLGADILQRLQYAHAGEGARLQTLLVDGLRRLIAQLCARAGCRPAAINGAAAAGNPGISCLLLNLPVAGLLAPPYKPPFKALLHIPVSEIDLGLAVPLQLLPPVSGFVGGDLVAALIAVERRCAPVERTCGAVELLNCLKPNEIQNSISSSVQQFNSSTVQQSISSTTLLIDIGTNAELALWDGERWLATSAAAGPAFEGGNISAGMFMTAGAVSDVRLAGDDLWLTVVGGGAPRGLCGSGLAALVAAAREGGLLDVSGRILAAAEVATNLGRYLVERDDAWAIRFHRDAAGELLLTQADLRNLQLAKGAVLAAVMVLLERSGCTAENVSRVLVTGALGTALPKGVLKRVALLPEPMLDKTSFVANGVLAGLHLYLACADGPQRLASLLGRIQPWPLSGTPAFERHFLTALAFTDC